VNQDWLAFETEIARWRDGGAEVEFWLRDDDAAALTEPLARLLGLAAAAQVPLALAVVPDWAENGWLGDLPGGVDVLQHGVDHRNRAAPQCKKAEFTAGEPLDAALRRLAEGKARLAALSRGRLLPVLVPPWNRLPDELVPRLAEAGFRGLSAYGARPAPNAVPGLTQVNTHVDLINWRQGRGFVGEETALRLAVRHLAARRAGLADEGEPTGWLTHHASHDEASWGFLAKLFELTQRVAGARWRRAADLFLARGPS
jgi:hypothetical protein